MPRIILATSLAMRSCATGSASVFSSRLHAALAEPVAHFAERLNYSMSYFRRWLNTATGTATAKTTAPANTHGVVTQSTGAGGSMGGGPSARATVPEATTSTPRCAIGGAVSGARLGKVAFPTFRQRRPRDASRRSGR